MLFDLQNALATTASTDIGAIVHNENNILLTLQDEANDSRVLQIRKYSYTSYTICDSYANGEAHYYDAESLQDLCATLVSLVII